MKTKGAPKISVVMSNFNNEYFIEKSIESILNQSFSDFELIIIDDASTDKSCQIIDKFSNDNRVRFIKLKESHGNYKAMNIGIDTSRGSFIAVMNSDDIADLDRLSIQYKFLKDNSFACTGSQGYFIDKDDNILGNLNNPTEIDLLKVSLLKNNFILHSSLLFNKQLLEKQNIHKYNENYFISSDYDFVVRCAYHFRIANIPERLMYSRVYPTQISATEQEYRTRFIRNIRFDMINRLGIIPTKKEMYTYNHLMEGTSLCQEELSAALILLNRVLKKNTLCKIYSGDILFNFFQNILNEAQINSEINLWNLQEDIFRFLELKLKFGSSILEFGSGCGTSQLLKSFKVTSIEHDFRYVLKRSKNHSIFHVPISNGWYDDKFVSGVIQNNKFDLILIDGPPGNLRQGILDNINLFSNITCPILFDDVNREEDMRIMHLFCAKLNYCYQIFQGPYKSFSFCEKSKENLG